MKKLAIVALLVLAGCTRKVVVQSPSPAAVGSNATGGATAREAVQRFMAAAKAQDVQAFASVWGTPQGPASGSIPKDELEKRAIINIMCLKHDSYRVLSDNPAENGERVFALENRYQDLTRTANFYVVAGPSNRWYVRAFDLTAVQAICARR